MVAVVNKAPRTTEAWGTEDTAERVLKLQNVMVTSETYAPAALTEIYCVLEPNYKTW